MPLAILGQVSSTLGETHKLLERIIMLKIKIYFILAFIFFSALCYASEDVVWVKMTSFLLAKPDIDSATIEVLKAGNKLTLVSKKDENWLKIKNENGKIGWVNSNWVSTEPVESSQPTNPPSSSNAQTVTTPAPTLPWSQWSYLQSDDAMGKGQIYQAGVTSTNTVNFDFPYSGAQHGTLILRTHPRYGKDIIFRIEKGQILCHSYEDCTVLVRFDDEEPTNYSAGGAADNSTETIFIRNYDKFMEKMLKAKRVRIAVNIYHEGAPVFEFDVSNFDQGKYMPNK